jgi:putative tryptophan/tyrosine transport system substrate-binding protein
LLQATRSIPLVFTQTPDRHVSSLARPGGNATGMKQIEFGMSAKWLEFLKQIAPHVTRVGVLRDVVNLEQGAQIGTLQIIFVLGNAREGHWGR